MKNKRIESEKKIVKKMIEIYCKGNHHGNDLCSNCLDLISYAQKRLEQCRFSEKKSFCSKCQIHCYENEYRKKICKVMSYSGPRLLFLDPLVCIKHFLTK